MAKMIRTFVGWKKFSKEIEPDNFALKYALGDWETERNAIIEIIKDAPEKEEEG